MDATCQALPGSSSLPGTGPPGWHTSLPTLDFSSPGAGPPSPSCPFLYNPAVLLFLLCQCLWPFHLPLTFLASPLSPPTLLPQLGSVWLCPPWTVPDVPASAQVSLLSAINLLVYGTWDQSRPALLLFLLSLTCLSPQRSVAPVTHRSFSAAKEDRDRNHSTPNTAHSTPATKVQGISQKRGRKILGPQNQEISYKYIFSRHDRIHDSSTT